MVFEQHLSGYERAQVLVDVLGRLTRYDVPTDWLKTVKRQLEDSVGHCYVKVWGREKDDKTGNCGII